MALLQWNDKYSVSVGKFDDQHKKLVQMINDLHDAMKVGKGRDVLGKILQSLVDYTVVHFGEEEKVMKAHNFPAFEQHKKEHNLLTIQVKEAVESHKQGQNVLTQDIMNFLKNWLTNHIQECDKKYGPFLNENGVA